MLHDDDQQDVQVYEEEQESGRRQKVAASFSGIHNHYYGPVNHVERAYNPNFGTNYGFINQNTYQNAPSMQWGGMALGGALLPTGIVGMHPVLAPSAELNSLLNPILDASHTRNLKLSPPNSQCFPGTRQQVIDDVRAWAGSDLDPATPHGLWIFGYAGCGKSAIAQAIAKHFAGLRLLAGCFFFFRGSGDRSRVWRFATTIASQLAAAIPETGFIIEATIKANPGLASAATSSLSDQFEYLVYRPIIAIASRCRAPYLIILDGVDECEDRDDVATLIENMIKSFNQHPHMPLRFLITSRVENHLHQVLHSASQIRLLNLVEQTSDSDIATALDIAIANAKRGRLLACDKSWPSPTDRWRLVKHIGGSFIFMTTIIKQLFDMSLMGGLTPMDRLPLVLSMKANFDDLYKEILTPWQHLRHFQDIIRTITLAFRPLTIAQIADILNIGTVNVVNVLINLHAIIQVPGDDRTPVTLWHTSLRDFLCTETRSGPFFASPIHNVRMGLVCIRKLAARSVPSQLSEYSCDFALDHLSRFLPEIEDRGLSRLSKGLRGPESHLKDRIDQLGEQLRGLKGYLDMPIFENYRLTALEVACCTKRWTLVRALVNGNVDVNIRFQGMIVGANLVSALHAACDAKQWGTIHLLLDKGASPNVAGSSTAYCGTRWGPPIAFASYHKDVKLVTRLLACGADPDIRGGNWGTCLYICAYRGYKSLTRILLEHRADPNRQDDYGYTALHAACFRGHISIAECLLEFKVDAGIRDINGRTALQLARDVGKEQVVQMLVQRGVVE